LTHSFPDVKSLKGTFLSFELERRPPGLGIQGRSGGPLLI